MSNNIEEDIKIVEKQLKEWKEDPRIMIQPEKFEFVQAYENAYKKNQNIVDKVKDIIEECIPKNPNVITGKEEYTPNTNANSYFTQKILELFEKED